MRLEQITLNNFRQYYGMQKIHFSKDKEKNITVLHGENGTGKTALLNAFSWCLYGKVDLPNPEDLINESIQMELKINDETETYVKLQFYNEGRMYYVTRTIKAKKNDRGKLDYFNPVLTVEYIDIDGRTVSSKAPQDLIEQIIPSDLKSYFFFDGERIDKMQEKEKAKDIKNAIKVVMGLEILERSIKHLDKVKDNFRSEIAELGNSEQQFIEKKMKEKEEEIRKKNEEKTLQEDNKVALEIEIKNVRDKLRHLEASKELQEKRDELEEDKEKIEKEYSDLIRDMRNYISKRGYLAFVGGAIGKAKDYLENKRERNEIPTGIKRQFVDDLLNERLCICGRTIEEGTESHDHILKWREQSSSKELEDAFINISGDLKLITNERENMFNKVIEYKKSETKIKKAKDEIQEMLSVIQSKLEVKDVEEISSLVKKERDSIEQLESIKDKIRRIEYDIESLVKEKNNLEKKFNEIMIENEKALLARRRLDIAENIKKTYNEVYRIRSEEVQIRLQTKISTVYNKLLRKGFGITLTDNYDIEVYKLLGSERKNVGLSQGERQLTSLSFIGALVDIAREQAEKEKEDDSNSMKFGGYYPIVMDSPFGQLDEDHQARVAQGLPSLAQQIIVIVSSSQWRGVEPFMNEKVGREYQLDFYGGKKDFTEIKEVVTNA